MVGVRVVRVVWVVWVVWVVRVVMMWVMWVMWVVVVPPPPLLLVNVQGRLLVSHGRGEQDELDPHRWFPRPRKSDDVCLFWRISDDCG